MAFTPPSFSQETNLLKDGIEQYKGENYEEAAEILIKARKQDPKSSPAAFFLGLTYKQMMDYPKALKNFRDAVTLTPKIAVFPLFDNVRLQLSGQAFLQDYKNNHTLLNNTKPREDETYTASLGLTWEFAKNTNLVAQCAKTRVNSNIGYYEYDEELYGLGLEYRY